MRHLVLFLLLASFSFATDGVPTANIPPGGWVPGTNVGVQGGIPTRPTIYTTLSSSSTTAQIQTALDNCPATQVVKLGAGTFNLTGSLTIDRDNVVLRGTLDVYGVPTTILDFGSSGSGWALINIEATGYPANNWAANTIRTLTGPLSRGDTSATLTAAPTGLSLDQLLVFDAPCDESLVIEATSVDGGATWGRTGDGATRTYMQFVKVTGISGNNVTFTPAIRGTYWSTLGSNKCYYFSGQVNYSGVEDLKITRASGSGGAHNTHMGPAVNCWYKNVWSTQCENAHLRTAWTLFCEQRDCYYSVHDDVGSSTYSTWLTFTGSFLVEGNIWYNTPCALGLISTSGSVVGHNFGSTFPYSSSTWLPECVMTHGGHPDFNLFEGNDVPSFHADRTHGNASYNTYVHNRVTGWESGKTQSTRPFNATANQDHLAWVGNIIGTSGYHTSYPGSGENAYFNIDSGAAATQTLLGNWNPATNGIPTAEALSGQTVADTYYLQTTLAHAGVLGAAPYYNANGASPGSATGANIPAGYRFADANHAWPAASGTPAAPINVRKSRMLSAGAN